MNCNRLNGTLQSKVRVTGSVQTYRESVQTYREGVTFGP